MRWYLLAALVLLSGGVSAQALDPHNRLRLCLERYAVRHLDEFVENFRMANMGAQLACLDELGAVTRTFFPPEPGMREAYARMRDEDDAWMRRLVRRMTGRPSVP